MIIDCTIQQLGDYILITDLTHKPEINKINIQIFTPRGKIVNSPYSFRKINVFGKKILGTLENGDYIFNINGILKIVNFKCDVELTEIEKAYFRKQIQKEPPLITKLKHYCFIKRNL